MRLHFRIALLVTALVFALPMIAVPNSSVQARPAVRQITITITELQLARGLRVGMARTIRKLDVDIIDGGIVVKIFTRLADLPEYHEHYGVLIRDGKVVVEPGVIAIPDVGAMGYENVKQLIPELVPTLDHNALVINRFVTSRIRARAGARYTPESVTTGNDKIVIVVNR